MIEKILKIENIVLAAIIVIFAYITTISTVIIFIITLLVFTLPGISVASKYCCNLPATNKIYFSILLGIPISSITCVIVGYYAGFNPLLFAVAIVIVAVCLMLLTSERLHPIVSYHKADRYYYIILAIVLIMLSYSYTNFGRLTTSGFMFKDLYATDLLHHMSVFRHLPKGLPPANPYFEGTAWHYYWISHMFPASVYTISGFTLNPKDIMYLTLCLNTVIFYNLLFTLVSTFYKERKTITIILIIALLAYGYNDLYSMFRYCVTLVPTDIKKTLGINFFIDDSYGGSFSGYSHGWFRNIIVEPHSTLALAITFLFVSIRVRNGYEKISLNLFMGSLLGFVFAFDAFIGTIIISWAAVEGINSQLKAKVTFRSIFSVVSAFIPVILMLIFLYMFGIVATGGSSLILKPFTKMLLLFPIYFIIDYGPQIIFAVIGFLSLRNNQKLIDELSPFFRLFWIASFFMFFINLSDIGSTQMFRKAGMIVRVPMIIYSGVFLDNISKWRIRNASAIIVIFILLAIPTPFVDIYNLGVITNRPSSVFITVEDVEACKWIKDNLPVDAILQDFPGESTPIVSFGERRVSLGDWEHAKSSGITPREIKKRLEMIKEIFSSKDSLVAYKISEELNIKYIYINKRCSNMFPSGSGKFKESTMFEEIFNTDGVKIYKLNQSRLPL